MRQRLPRGAKPGFFLRLGVSVVLLFQASVAQVTPDSGGTLSSQPVHLRFHQVIVGQNSSMSVILTNNGPGSVTVSSVTHTNAQFKLRNLKVPFTLRANTGIQFGVIFSPDASTRFEDEFVFTSDAGNSPYSLYTHGNGVPEGSLTTNPNLVQFGNVPVGDKESDYVTLTNTGSSSITISQARVEGAVFSVSGLDLPTTLTSGQRMTFRAIFSPQAEGKSSGYIVLASDAPNPKLRIGLAGAGTQAGRLDVGPKSMDFGDVVVQTGKTQKGALVASGADVTVTSAVITSPEFTLRDLTLPLTIPAGQTVSFSVRFRPRARGQVNGELIFSSNASNAPTVESLTGTGVSTPDHYVSLSWKPSKSPDVVGYNIYRSEQKRGGYSKLNDSLDPFTNYADQTVQGGKTYYYATTAVDSSGNESRRSNKVEAIIPYP